MYRKFIETLENHLRIGLEFIRKSIKYGSVKCEVPIQKEKFEIGKIEKKRKVEEIKMVKTMAIGCIKSDV